MSKKCQKCGKGPASGHNVSHSMRHTKRVFVPNLVSKRMVINGSKQKIKVCTRCLKTMLKKD